MAESSDEIKKFFDEFVPSSPMKPLLMKTDQEKLSDKWKFDILEFIAPNPCPDTTQPKLHPYTLREIK